MIYFTDGRIYRFVYNGNGKFCGEFYAAISYGNGDFRIACGNAGYNFAAYAYVCVFGGNLNGVICRGNGCFFNF